MSIIGVDSGYRNLGWVVFENYTVTSWHHTDLWPYRKGIPRLDDIIGLTIAWIKAHKDKFERAKYIVLERQMKKKFIVQNTIIRAYFNDKVIMIHPLTMPKFYNIPTTRRDKKWATMQLMKKMGFVCPVDCEHRYDAAALAVYGCCQTDPSATLQTFLAE